MRQQPDLNHFSRRVDGSQLKYIAGMAHSLLKLLFFRGDFRH